MHPCIHVSMYLCISNSSIAVSMLSARHRHVRKQFVRGHAIRHICTGTGIGMRTDLCVKACASDVLQQTCVDGTRLYLEEFFDCGV